ncbi:multicopper oxidase family protein [Tessaracoccus antarcticus]|uniref:multicopper oxidase family protein n=1 Tax=Tessaracoccus antarcticus TaxID=2479848 RepID=UPI001F21E0F2|nr:multicopper oxidase family protein [Tessaracoccus antarcticus]
MTLGPVCWLWASSLMPAAYSVLDMGYPDHGGGPSVMDHGEHTMPSRSVTDFVADPGRVADVTFDLVAREQEVTIGGRAMPGYTLNGRTPGPMISAVVGQLIEVHLWNQSVAAGVSLHWHGLDVPNAMDGVAGVTQDDVGVGEEFTYRFVAEDEGTYWYHSHQASNEQVSKGLFGPLVVRPSSPASDMAEVIAVAHVYGGNRTLNGRTGDQPVEVRPGERVRVRIINTDNGPMDVWVGTSYTVLAVDGRELHGPTPVAHHSLVVTAGGRADLEVRTPRDGTAVRVQLSQSTAVILGHGAAPPVAHPTSALDMLHYGTRTSIGFDPGRPDRVFKYSIGRQPGFYRGRPGMYWSINGHLYPDVPMFVVEEGDVAVMRIANHSGEVHPMHLHGHHAVVLSRNGVASTGSPWWVDSLNVLDGETYDIAFLADNPGIWMDHCHNLKHAAMGMIAHLMYAGVTTSFVVGGQAGNQPE